MSYNAIILNDLTPDTSREDYLQPRLDSESNNKLPHFETREFSWVIFTFKV